MNNADQRQTNMKNLLCLASADVIELKSQFASEKKKLENSTRYADAKETELNIQLKAALEETASLEAELTAAREPGSFKFASILFS